MFPSPTSQTDIKASLEGYKSVRAQELERQFPLFGSAVIGYFVAVGRMLSWRDHARFRLHSPSVDTTRQRRGIPVVVTRLITTILVASLVVCVACGSPGGSGNSQLPTGPRAGQLAVHQTSLTFGTVLVGNSSSQTVTVTAFVASVTISQTNVMGDDFSVIAPALPTTLMAGQSASFTVEFAPSVAGSVTGIVSLVSNAANVPTTIAVSGTGADISPPPSHSVALSWDPSTSTDVVGYYVNRGQQSGGPYVRLTSLPIAATTYTDTTVTAGNTYYYVVTAVSGNGLESVYSNQASATIASP